MKDLTSGPVTHHILRMAGPISVNMLSQTAYHLVNLYFLTRIGTIATAGVNAAASVVLIVSALAQVLGVGTVASIAQAAGRKNRAQSELAFNQALLLSVCCGLALTISLAVCVRSYLGTVAADSATAEAGVTYVMWALPGYALALPMTVISSALRAQGVVLPTFLIYMATVVINAFLAPILIAGWLTGMPFGVMGAGLASSAATGVGLILLAAYFLKRQDYLSIQHVLLRPHLRQCSAIVWLGAPAGGEFVLTFIYTAVAYYVIQRFGAAAQAGFGIGSRILQTIVMPGMSVALAAAPIAGQNFGAQQFTRVVRTFRDSALICTVIMLVLTILLQWRTDLFLRLFDADDATAAAGDLFLALMSWTLVAQGLVYTCSSMFQGVGNTMPMLASSALRLAGFAGPVLWLSSRPGFRIEDVWYISIASMLIQTVASLWLLRLEFAKRLPAAVRANA